MITPTVEFDWDWTEDDMNQVQLAIAKVTGLDDVIEGQNSLLGELRESQEHLITDNQMLRREIEDLDYLNLWDPSQIQEILPIRDRAKALARLRRLRHDNPLAKQSIKLIVRFTLGKGIQWIVAQPEEEVPDSEELSGGPPEPSEGAIANNGSSATPRAPSQATPTKFVQLPRSARSLQEALATSPSEPGEPEELEEEEEDDEEEGGGKLLYDPDDDPTRQIIDDFWTDAENELAFTTHESLKQLVDDVATDGEKFFACFEDSAAPYLKVAEVPTEEIKQIIYNPDNKAQPVLYKRQYQKSKYNAEKESYEPDGAPITQYYMDYRITEDKWAELKRIIKIPESKIPKSDNGRYIRIHHSGINWLWTKSGRRGVSELYASREWFRVFREFMEGRAAINQAAQAISYLRKIKGGPSTVASFSGQFGGLPVGQSAGSDSDELRKLTQPVSGAIYDSNEGVDLEWMKTDTGAANAKEDARLLLMSAGAGTSTFVHYFGEGGDSNLATAQSMELPMVKNYEDWQQWVEDFLGTFFRYVLRIATDEENAKEEMKRVGFTFPPIISQDVVKYTTSWAQIVRDIAPNNRAVRKQAIRSALVIMGVPNIDGLMPEIEAEMDRAEVQRQQQTQAMLSNFGTADANPFNKPSPNGNGKMPTSGMNPNLQHLAAGKGEKVSNGPKPE